MSESILGPILVNSSLLCYNTSVLEGFNTSQVLKDLNSSNPLVEELNNSMVKGLNTSLLQELHHHLTVLQVRKHRSTKIIMGNKLLQEPPEKCWIIWCKGNHIYESPVTCPDQSHHLHQTPIKQAAPQMKRKTLVYSITLGWKMPV